MEELSRRIYIWNVRCIDRQSKRMFDRRLLFDPEKCIDDGERRSVEAILDGGHGNRRLIEYRHTFREVNQHELERERQNATAFRAFGVADYFEDEDQNPLDEIELIAIVSGQLNPIIMGNTSSVIRLGPSGMRNAAHWTVADSNDFVHFLQVVAILQRSRWFQTSPELSETSESSAYTLENPDLDSTTGALALLRQFLRGRDDVFRTAVHLYLNHVDDDGKAAWVECELQQFEAHLKGDDRMPSTGALRGIRNGELIDVFVYGTGLFHRRSDKNLEEKLSQLTANCSREELMFAFEMACRTMLGPPFTVAPLFYREFAHWSNTGLCPRPTRVVIKKLFDESQ